MLILKYKIRFKNELKLQSMIDIIVILYEYNLVYDIIHNHAYSLKIYFL